MDDNLDNARQVVRGFVAGPWSAKWEDMIEKASSRGGCVLDALGLNCSPQVREKIRSAAAKAIRQRHANPSQDKTTWDGKKGLWTDQEVDELVDIVQRIAVGLGAVTRAVCTTGAGSVRPLQKPDPAVAAADVTAAIVREFSQLSYNASDWEKLIGVSTVSSHGCLLDAWGMSCSADQREQAKISAATALRKAYPQYTNSPAAWQRKLWTDTDVDDILRIAFEAVTKALDEPWANGDDGDAGQHFVASDAVEPSGFVPWRPFRSRRPTSNVPGIYVVAYYTGGPERYVDPLSEHVIYIGLAAGQGTGDRLDQFERTALGGLGHTGGWSYRVHFAPEVFDNRYSLLRKFHNTYCSWLAVPDGSVESPRDVERRLLSQYQEIWGRWPRLNRQG